LAGTKLHYAVVPATRTRTATCKSRTWCPTNSATASSRQKMQGAKFHSGITLTGAIIFICVFLTAQEWMSI